MAIEESSTGATADMAVPEGGDPDSDADEGDESRRTIRGRARMTALTHNHHPYGLNWTVEECVLDDDHEVTVDDTGGFHVSLLGERDWSEVTLKGTITVPTDVYRDVVPAAERGTKDAPPTALHVTIDCRDAILREAQTVADPAGPGDHPFEVTLPIDRVYGTVKLYPVLVRREPFGGDSGQCAAEIGHRLAETTPATVDIDVTDELAGLFHPKRRKFSEEDEFPPEDHLVHLVLEGEDAPQLYLNGDHEELITVLDTRANQGKDASLRNVAFDLIEAELWPQLIMATANDVDSAGEPEHDWQWDVLRQVAKPLYGPGTGPQDAGIRLQKTVNSPDELPALQMKIEDFVQSRVGAPSHLKTLLNYLR